MRILYVGDIMGELGLAVVERVLPNFKQTHKIDLVVAQAENVTDGKGVNLADFTRLKKAGVDFCTGGNWTIANENIYPALSDPNQPIIRPANLPEPSPGLGYKYLHTTAGSVLVISLLGQIVGKDSALAVDNPLHVVDSILLNELKNERAATIVNFHGDYSSEKVVIGHYLDGRASMVVGDHWHVPTADAQILPGGTAHISDVGMCGSLDSSLGVQYEVIIGRWKNNQKSRNVLESNGRTQFNAVLVDVDASSGKATSIEHIRQVFD